MYVHITPREISMCVCVYACVTVLYMHIQTLCDLYCIENRCRIAEMFQIRTELRAVLEK